MTKARKGILGQTSKVFSCSKIETGLKLNLLIHNKSNCKMSYGKRCMAKSRYAEAIASILSRKKASEFSVGRLGINSLDRKRMRRTIQKEGNTKNGRKRTSLQPVNRKTACLKRKQGGKNAADGEQRTNKRRRKKKRKKHIELDEASRLQRRTRYLLIKMKLEQNLIDAYSAEGWKGQSREKIKPEKELQRAMKQILRCKLGIREAVHQLELLSSEGCIEDAVMNSDGSVFHEHIFCAKCKSRDIFPDNDIILCDGTCNCAFHQKCLEPPLATENIPPGDQGWLCKFCEHKMEILEAVNAHMGTSFSINSNWQDIFKEAATASDGENASVDLAEEWPSDDSEDADYDPESNTRTGSRSQTDEDALCDDSSSSSSFFWSSEEASSPINILNGEFLLKSERQDLDGSISVNSVDAYDCDAMSQRRQRKDVDYKKLYDEMFGKAENEQLSEDEDWGPHRRKQRGKCLNAGMVAVRGADEFECLNNELRVRGKLPTVRKDRKSLFRIPPNAVEKLRQVFSENELPSRATREHLSNQLGISSEKVNKWFKNARYMALRIRKAENRRNLSGDEIAKASNTDLGRDQIDNQAQFTANSCLVSSATSKSAFKNLRRMCLRKNLRLMTTPPKQQCSRSVDGPPSNVIQVGSGIQYKKEMICSRRKSSLKKSKEKITCCGNETRGSEQIFVEMERLFLIEDRIRELNKLLRYISSLNETYSDEGLVMYVPVAEVKEKILFPSFHNRNLPLT